LRVSRVRHEAPSPENSKRSKNASQQASSKQASAISLQLLLLARAGAKHQQEKDLALSCTQA
jgi:hypothetical protein